MKFIIDHDFHLHSHLSLCSGDPTQTPEALIRYAKENALRRICITDHFWDERVEGASEWYKKQNFAHITSDLPLPHDDDVDLFFGCEADMNKLLCLGVSPERLDYFDFIAVPTNHLHMTTFTVEEGDRSVARRAELFMKRNSALLDMDLPFYKMGIAHFTDSLMAYYSDGTRDEVMGLISDSMLYELFERIASCGMGVELNMPLSDCASEAVLRSYRIAKSCGCKFYLGSDAHTAKQLSAAMSRFRAIVDALDLTEDDKFVFPKK